MCKARIKNAAEAITGGGGSSGGGGASSSTGPASSPSSAPIDPSNAVGADVGINPTGPKGGKPTGAAPAEAVGLGTPDGAAGNEPNDNGGLGIKKAKGGLDANVKKSGLGKPTGGSGLGINKR
ncbi:hypothetical protein [Phyllobacterium endophyticum]|uniref:hypothetical protein n=1 Tax=Phyllobacterium endophyticum TaxID=1149773 RepID=UPI0011C85767|nr:hypothetical protein [Phyllobacterium endophyticum]TXR49900.1 hypothetical protein FVA77_07760 [Phyllobacterium endophyticum]